MLTGGSNEYRRVTGMLLARGRTMPGSAAGFAASELSLPLPYSDRSITRRLGPARHRSGDVTSEPTDRSPLPSVTRLSIATGSVQLRS